MIAVLSFLLFHSWKNRMAMRIRRLKQPKYLFGALFGAAYFYLYFFRYLLNPHRAGGLQGLVRHDDAGACIGIQPGSLYIKGRVGQRGSNLVGAEIMVVRPEQRGDGRGMRGSGRCAEEGCKIVE